MSRQDHRKHPRIDAVHLLNYVCLDQGNEPWTQGMGRTLNVSESGILLETHVPLEEGVSVAVTLGLEESLIQLTGRVVYSKPSQDDETKSEVFVAGIEFSEINPEELNHLEAYIQLFKKAKDVEPT